MSDVFQTTGEKFKEIFLANQGYETFVLEEKREDGKRKSKTTKIYSEITAEDYVKHLTTGRGLTLSPFISDEFVGWGAIDIDEYTLTDEELKHLIIKCRNLGLIACKTKSGGIHLYALSSEDIPAKWMIQRLKYCRDELNLDPKVEIFPKQDTKDKVGNGITIPYRGHFNKEHNLNCTALEVINDVIEPMRIGEFINRAWKMCSGISYGKEYHKKYESYQDIVQYTDEAQSKESSYNLTQIIKAIKENREHSNGGTYDNWITLYISKAVRGMKTNEEIFNGLEAVRNLKNEEYPKGFDQTVQYKIDRCRKKFDIEDPKIIRKQILKKYIYILGEDRYYDIEKRKAYKVDVIDRSNARYFQKPTCTNWIKVQPERLEVENWTWNPKTFNEDNPIIEVNGLKYLNAYKPNKLEPVQGDIKLWTKLINYIFTNNKRHIKQFLDWLAFQLQNPGEKIRYAVLIVSKEEQIGKGSIWRIIEELFGYDNVKIIDVSEALDHAKNYLKSSAIVLIDEMESTGKWDEKKSLLNSLKRIITESRFSHRARYSDYDEDGLQSCTNIIMFTNNKDALSLPKRAKRYAVYFHEQERLPQSFYDEYHKWVDEGGASAVLNDLLKRDIDDFNPKSVAPETSFTDKMSMLGSHPLAQFLQRRLEENFDPMKQDIVSVSGIYQYLKDTREGGRVSMNVVASQLEFIGGEKREQCTLKIYSDDGKDETKRLNLYIIRNHEKYRNTPNSEIADLYWYEYTQKNKANKDQVSESDIPADSLKPQKKVSL